MPVLTTRANASALNTLTGKKKALPYQWVVAYDSKIWTSTSTTAASGTWTSRTSSFGTSIIRDIASNGVDLYVAVGQSGKLATSPDGITWTQRTSGFGTTQIEGIAYGNGYWVAVGGAGKMYTSTDGTTWSAVTSSFSTTIIYRVEYGNGKWVASGAGGKVASTGSDPTTGWTQRTTTLSDQARILGYSTYNSIWIGGTDGGTTGAFQSSTDGTTWTSRNSANNTSTGTPGGIVNNSSVIVEVDNSITSTVQSSTNGTSWTSRSLTSSGQYPGMAAVDRSELIVMCGYAEILGWPSISTTSDGVTWSTSYYIEQAAVANQVFICHSSGRPGMR